MSDEEYRTHLTLWVMAPMHLAMGHDVNQMSTAIKALLLNKEIMAIGLDPLSASGRKVDGFGDTETWAKPLSDGATVIALVNRGAKRAILDVRWVDIGLGREQHVRDLWRQTSLGRFKDAYYVSVPAHGAVLLKVTPARDSRPPLNRSVQTRTRSIPP
jgi:alpha-galactosidase